MQVSHSRHFSLLLWPLTRPEDQNNASVPNMLVDKMNVTFAQALAVELKICHLPVVVPQEIHFDFNFVVMFMQ